MTLYRKMGKRAAEIALGLPIFIVAAPLMGLIALSILATMGSPVLFRQFRPGKDGRPFALNKFRTMTPCLDENGNRLTDKERMTTFGRFLRKFSLDELPELWNVVKGEMSLVGPRPLLVAYLARYTPVQARRHDVKPGMTGWAQVNGRNAITWKEKFRYDIWYVDHVTFGLDMEILALTTWKVLKREGINQPGVATMNEYLGSNVEK